MNTIELENFKKELFVIKNHILQNIDFASKEMEELLVQENNDIIDYASVLNDTLIEQSITDQQQSELIDIDIALKRMDAGNYDICEMCSEPISISRLKAKPFARFCITCRPIYEKELE